MFDVVPSIPFSQAPSPPTHSPTLIELFVSPPVIVGGELRTVYSTLAKTWLHFPPTTTPTVWVQLKICRKAKKRRKGRFSRAISHNRSCDQAFHKRVLNNGNYIWLRFTKAFPGITSKLHLTWMQELQEGLQRWIGTQICVQVSVSIYFLFVFSSVNFYPPWLSNFLTRRDNIKTRISVFVQALDYCFSPCAKYFQYICRPESTALFQVFHDCGNAA